MMKRIFDRRTVLEVVLSAAAGICLPRVVLAETVVSGELEVTKLDDALLMVTGAGGNIVAAAAGGAAVMIDGGLKSRSAELLSLVRNELSVSRIDTLFNTCWHPSRTGSNEELGSAGAKIIAHENTRLWLGRDIKRPWEDETIMRLPPPARPNDTFYESGSTELGGLEMRYAYMLQAHTDGDMYVHFPAENVLVTGAAVSADQWPLIDWWTGGWIGGLIDGLNTLLAVVDGNTRVVPGSGGLLTRADLVELREMYITIYDRLAEMFFAALDAEEVLAAAPTREFDQRFGNSELFVRLAFRGFGLHFSPDA